MERVLRIKAVESFAQAPAVVAAVDDDIDLLPPILTDVGNDQIMFAAAIERNAPRIAQAVSVDFRQARFAIGERIVPGNAVGNGRIHVETKDLAEQSVELL